MTAAMDPSWPLFSSGVDFPLTTQPSRVTDSFTVWLSAASS